MAMCLKTGLIVKENCFDPTLERTQFSFTHIAYRDFFAAVYIASHFSKESIPKSKLHKLFETFEGETIEMSNISKLSNILTIVCGVDPSMITHISKIVYSIVENDSQRTEYIMDIEDGKDVESELIEQTQNIQDLISNLLHECDFSDELPRVNVCDIIVQKKADLDLVRQVCPEAVQSLNIDRHCLDEEVVRAIQGLIHLQTLAIRKRENEIPGTVISPLITKANSLIQLILFNENLSLDLSRHENLTNIALNRCKHLFISSVNKSQLETCEIRGLMFPHEHFDLMSPAFATSLCLTELTLNDIKCDRTECRYHHLDLSANKNIRSITLENCNSLFFNISSSGLHTCVIRRCFFTHTQMKELMNSITKVASLNTLEINSVSCHDRCEGHSFNLSGKKCMKTLCLENCKRVGFFSNTCVQVNSCTIRHCSLSHDQWLGVSSFLERSYSLTVVVLSSNECGMAICRGHKIDLCKHKQLQNLRSTDICIFPYRLNCVSLNKFYGYICKPTIELPDGMKYAGLLKIFKVEAVSTNALFTSQTYSVLHTFKQLQQIELHRIDIENESLSVLPDMENLTNIVLSVVQMNEITFLKFVESLKEMKQCIHIRTSSLKVTPETTNTFAVEYVKKNAAFEVLRDPTYDFSFKLNL